MVLSVFMFSHRDDFYHSEPMFKRVLFFFLSISCIFLRIRQPLTTHVIKWFLYMKLFSWAQSGLLVPILLRTLPFTARISIWRRQTKTPLLMPFLPHKHRVWRRALWGPELSLQFHVCSLLGVLRFVFYENGCFAYMDVCVPHVYNALRGQKRVLVPWN